MNKADPVPSKGFRKWIIFFTISFCIFVVDIATKQLVEAKIKPFQDIKITDFLNIVYVVNRGGVFGIFSNFDSEFFRWGMNIVSILVMLALLFFARTFDIKTFYVIGVMFGGAAGNVYERLTKGYVVDFIDFHVGRWHWPAFNIADSVITLGLIYIIIKAIVVKK